MAILDFMHDMEHSGLKDFWKLKEHDIPRSPGAYILIATGNTHFTYPVGRSPIFYIGQSKNLRTRLYAHLKHSDRAKSHRELKLYWPRYEFSAAYGGRYCYVRTWQGLTPRALEEILLAKFAKKHLCFPIANGAGAWKRINKLMEEV